MTDLTAIRERLIEEAKTLATRVSKIESHLRGEDRDTPDDWSDRAQVLENDEVLEALDDRDRKQILSIRAALQRIDAGTYETCESCGKKIPAARLVAVPHTTTCVHCAG